MPLTNPSYVFGEDLKPARFVKQDTANDHTILHATNGDGTVGVTHNGTFEAPIPGASELVGRQGESGWVHGEDAQAEILAGAAISAGDMLGPATVDLSSVGLGAAEAGVAIPVTANNAKFGARARAAAALGEKVQVQVISGVISSA